MTAAYKDIDWLPLLYFHIFCHSSVWWAAFLLIFIEMLYIKEDTPLGLIENTLYDLNVWRNIIENGNIKKEQDLIERTSLFIAKDIGDMKVTIWGHPGTFWGH